MARRVRRPAGKDQLLKSMTENQHPFATMADALIFAAALGFAEDRRVAFEKSSEQIPWEVFANTGSVAIIDMIAAAVDDEIEILADDRADDRLTIFEEFANGGLEIVRDRLSSDHRPARPPLDTLLDLVHEYGEDEVPKGTLDLEAIASELSS